MNNETLTNLVTAYRSLMDASTSYDSVWMLTPLVIVFCALIIGYGGWTLANKLKPIPSENTQARESRMNKFGFVAVGSGLVALIALYFVGEHQDKMFIEKNTHTIEMALELLQIDRDDPVYRKAFESPTSAQEVLREAARAIEPAMNNLLSIEVEQDLKTIGSNKPVLKMLQEGIDETSSGHRISSLFALLGVLGSIGATIALIAFLNKLTGNTPIKAVLGILMFVGVMTGARVGIIEFQQNSFAALTPETKQISEKVVQAYNQYHIYSGQFSLNPSTAHSLLNKQVKGIRSARFVSDPRALQPESRVVQLVSKWNKKSQG